MDRRAFVIVIDACGAGELPDSGEYGDAGSNTLGHVAEAVGGLDLPVMQSLGLGNALALAGCPPARDPALHGRLGPLGPGKDTIAGHWELMGVVTPAPLPTYPDGFPAAITDAITAATGRPIICNRPHSGLEVIDDYGAEHLQTGALIVYTSADSVLQIAAHVDVVAEPELQLICQKTRAIMRGRNAIGRVIARPFDGEPGAFQRTDGRHDYAVDPPTRSYMQAIDAPVHTVGKIAAVFNHVGVDFEHPGPTNAIALAATDELVKELDAGLVFVNLVETDQVYGHRKDSDGFHAALRTIDDRLKEWLELLDPARDLLVVTADHGCDPRSPGTDHTREHVPLLARFDGAQGRRHDGAMADVGASCHAWLMPDARPPGLPGRSFI